MIEFKEAPLVLIGATDATPEAYAALAKRYDLPIQLGASTPPSLAVLRNVARASGARIIVAGVIDPRTADVPAIAGADLLYATGFAALDELHEASHAVAQAKRPFALALHVNAGGTMVDGATLSAAIARLDADATARPWHYTLACSEPAHASAALETLFRSAPALAHRVVGLDVTVAGQTDGGIVASAACDVAQNFGLNVLGVGPGTNGLEAIAAYRP